VKDRIAEVARRDVSRETFDRIEAYVELLSHEARRQNLISVSTLDEVWTRHILDSAQLLRFEPHDGASWVDIGAGAGLPGIAIACLASGPLTLVEPRRLRAEFLQNVVRELGLTAEVIVAKAERIGGAFDVITGRAVAPLTKFLGISRHLSTGKSVWVLPKGRNAVAELDEARRAWQGVFHVERSATDADSFIVVASEV
jgi:16S rRNA (guanine527-N7)-methyltransferase